MTDDPAILAIAVLGGLLAGIINTLAGNGSAITLSIMTELIGLPPNNANGTNRVGIAMQGVTSSFSFVKNKKLDLRSDLMPIVATVTGAIVGILLALNVSNDQFYTVFKYLLVLMLFVILINPKKWLRERDPVKIIKHPLALPVFFALGFYGGFIQMGMGIAFLVLTVIVLKYDLISANVLKTAVVAIYTFIAVIIFEWNGMIDWKIGLVIGIGQAIGGYLAAEFLSKDPRAQIWAYVLLIIMVIVAILSTFRIIQF